MAYLGSEPILVPIWGECDAWCWFSTQIASKSGNHFPKTNNSVWFFALHWSLQHTLEARSNLGSDPILLQP